MPTQRSSGRFLALTDGYRFVHLFNVERGLHLRLSVLRLHRTASAWDWYVESPEGYVAGSPGALGLLSFPRSLREGGTVPLAEAAQVFGATPSRPNLLQEFLR
jgi:hypothetical protein